MSQEAAAFVVIAGFGLPGRMLVEKLCKAGIDYKVIELNAQTVARAAAGGIKIMGGDASEAQVLRSAGVDRATLVALMVPDEDVVLKALVQVRLINSKAKIIARCKFTSTGLEAMRQGATATIVAEQVVARELDTMIDKWFAKSEGKN